MRPSKSHFVTSCQQLLALGAVLAVLTPAASVVSLDVIRTPGEEAGTALPGASPEGRRALDADTAGEAGPEREVTARVPAEPVEAVVREVALTPQRDAAEGAPEQAPEEGPQQQPEEQDAEQLTRTRVLSEPQRVIGYGAVGVTWSHDDEVEDDRITLQVRTATDGTWSGWQDLEYHDEHAPDPATEEGAGTRPGTDPLFVGEVDRVQLRAVAPDGLPEDMSLAVVAPGDPGDEVREEAAVTAESPVEASATSTAADGEDAIELQAAATSAPRPKIFTREQWGADERLRSGSPSYGTISAAFVHHTVNSNTYTRDDVPGMLRSIYAYHTQSRGWSDVGYNFLVDKFGRIWEGRYGGVARAVIGAHTLGYNGDSFAMSAIGNFDTAEPPTAMLKAYGALFAWKLGLAGIDPTDMSQRVNGDMFAAINGHRDAGSTACPGRFLYAKLGAIRRYADEAGDAPEPPEPPKPPKPEPLVLEQVDTDLVGTPHPDLVVRRQSDGRGMVLPTGGLGKLLAPVTLADRGFGGRAVQATPDITGDGVGDAVTFDDRGRMEVRPGPADSGYRTMSRVVRVFGGHDLVTSVGDLDDDDRADFVGRAERRLVTFRATRAGWKRMVQDDPAGGYVRLSAAGDVTGDGDADLWAQDRQDRLWLLAGTGTGGFDPRVRVPGDWSGVESLAGGNDLNADGVPDLVVLGKDGAVALHPGRGDGTLARALPMGRFTGLRSLSGAGQLAGGDAADLMAVDRRGALVAVPNRGTFDLGRPIDTGQSFARTNLLRSAGDFDGDGHGDVLVRRKVGSLWLMRGRGDGRLADPQWIGGKNPFAQVNGLQVVKDVTGDGKPDLVGRLDGVTYAWPGAGAGRLGERVALDVAADTARTRLDRSAYDWMVATSDLLRRGAADLVVRDEDGYVYRLNGSGKAYAVPRYLGEARGFDLAG